ncbi:MAG: hypothetical protein GX802_07085 [Clostridiales bacterium]|nr:hypothetical protein [Clostridiales bacterium]
MKKSISLILALIMLVVLFAGCNSKPTVTTPTATPPTPTSTNTPAPTTLEPTQTPETSSAPANMHASGELRDESGKVVAWAMSLVVENNDILFSVENEAEESVFVDFNTIYDFKDRNGKLDIVKVEGGHIIIDTTTNGFFQPILAAFYDGKTLTKVDFSFDEYLSADDNNRAIQLFSIKWGKGTKFTVTPKGGEAVEFTVNEEKYNKSASGQTFEDFDKEAAIVSVTYRTKYLHIEEATGNLVMSAYLTFDGTHAGVFAIATISFAFDAKTTAFTIKNIEYEIKD